MFTPLPSTKSNVSSGQGKGLVLSPNVSPVSGASAPTLPSSYTLCGNQSQDTSPPLEPTDVRTWLTTWKSRLPCAKGRSLDSAFSIENQGSAGEGQGVGRTCVPRCCVVSRPAAARSAPGSSSAPDAHETKLGERTCTLSRLVGASGREGEEPQAVGRREGRTSWHRSCVGPGATHPPGRS